MSAFMSLIHACISLMSGFISLMNPFILYVCAWFMLLNVLISPIHA